MSKTYKEQEDRQALSKNNGKHIRYRKRIQEEQEAEALRKEELKRLTKYEERENEDS